MSLKIYHQRDNLHPETNCGESPEPGGGGGGLVAQSCPTLHNPMDCSTPAFRLSLSPSLLELKSIESTMLSNHFILCRPLLLLPSIFRDQCMISHETSTWLLRDRCMISHVSSALSDTFSVHDQSREQCMIIYVICA